MILLLFLFVSLIKCVKLLVKGVFKTLHTLNVGEKKPVSTNPNAGDFTI